MIKTNSAEDLMEQNSVTALLKRPTLVPIGSPRGDSFPHWDCLWKSNPNQIFGNDHMKCGKYVHSTLMSTVVTSYNTWRNVWLTADWNVEISGLWSVSSEATSYGTFQCTICLQHWHHCPLVSKTQLSSEPPYLWTCSTFSPNLPLPPVFLFLPPTCLYFPLA